MDIQAVHAAYGKSYEAKKSGKKSVPSLSNNIKSERVEISNNAGKSASEIQMVKAVVDEISEIRLDVVKEIKARIKANDYPLENHLDEMVKKMIQSNILNPL